MNFEVITCDVSGRMIISSLTQLVHSKSVGFEFFVSYIYHGYVIQMIDLICSTDHPLKQP